MATRKLCGRKVKHIKNETLFSEAAAEWLSAKSLSVKPSTCVRYKASLDSHILPLLGNHAIEKLTTADIGAFAKEKLINGRLDKKGGLAPKTVIDMLCVIKSVLDFAFEAKIIRRPVSVQYPKYHSQPARVLNRKEQTLLEEELKKDTDIYKLGVLLCLYTGIRIGELCALCWEDISIEHEMITVKGTLQRVKDLSGSGSKTRIEVGAPKSLSSARSIPIPKFLIGMIREHSKGKQGYFLGTGKKGYTEPRTMQNHFARITKQLNIPNANFHALRHTFATRCVEAGVDIKSLSEMLGHSSVNITLNRYVHSSFEQKRAGICKLELFCGVGAINKVAFC